MPVSFLLQIFGQGYIGYRLITGTDQHVDGAIFFGNRCVLNRAISRFSGVFGDRVCRIFVREAIPPRNLRLMESR